MGKIQNSETALQDLIKNIDLGKYVIPKFQRPIVWNKKDVESLGDSIVRGYPISLILEMPVNGTLDINYRPINNGCDISRISTINLQYLLDGQQRITSLAKIFLSYDNKNEYYFDLLSILVEKFPNDNITLDSGIKSKLDNNNNQFSPISDMFCRGFAISINKDERTTRQYNRFISGKAVFESRYGSIIPKFLRIFEDKDEQTIDKYMDYLSDVIGSINSYGVPFTTISEDAGLDLVIRVFEKVNTTGRRLTLFDLINAKSFQTVNINYDKGLANYFQDSIEKYITKNNKPNNIFNKLLEYNERTNTYDNVARIVRVITIAESIEKNHQAKLTNAYMLSKDADYWYVKWQEYEQYLLEFFEWLENEDLTNIGRLTFYEYIASIIMIYPNLLKNETFLKEIKKYALYISVTGKNFNRSDIDSFYKFVAFGKYLQTAHQFDKYTFKDLPKTAVDFDANEISQIRSSKNAYYGMLYILYKLNHNQKCTLDLLSNKIEYTNNSKRFDEHHIIPIAMTKANQKSIFGSIANITLLNSNTNRFDIKDKHPKEYFYKLKETYKNKEAQFELILSQNLLEHYDINNPIDDIKLLEIRAKKIADIINDFFS